MSPISGAGYGNSTVLPRSVRAHISGGALGPVVPRVEEAMQVRREWKEHCVDCGQLITVRDYIGIPGGLYSDHYCFMEDWETYG